MLTSGPGNSDVLPPLEETYPVFSFLLDPMERMSLPATFGIFGDAAGRDATRRGWGYHELKSRNMAWVLIRATVEITRQPGWGETITVRTWPKVMEGVTAFRDFQILDKMGNVGVCGTTAWTLIDLNTRRPVRLIGKEFETGELASRHAIRERPLRIAWPTLNGSGKSILAEYGHLDMNNHVNNTRYIEWIINEIPLEVLTRKQLRKAELNFLAEVRHLDPLSVQVTETRPGSGIFEGFIQIDEGNRQAFAARITFV